jgi:ribosomal protein S6--L-glutamate ligase
MNNRGRVRIGFLLERLGPGNGTPRVSSLTNEIIDRLVDRDVLVDLIIPEDRLLDIADVRAQHDLYVLKSETLMALSLAGALTVSGAVVVNNFRSCNLTRDKIAATAVLAAAGVPVPPSWATGRRALLQPLLAEGPIWLKPRCGRGGTGVSRVVEPSSLSGQDAVTDIYGLPVPIFTQREVPSDGRDLKVFVAGSHVWAVKRQFPAHTTQEKMGTAVTLASDVQEAALKCGKVLGLELYGVDFLVAEGRFYVVDVNAFPGYKGAAGAPWTLANFIYRRALHARNGYDG